MPSQPAEMSDATTTVPATAAAAADGMTITVHRARPATTLVRVVGEVDLATAPHLDRVLREVCSEPDPGVPQHTTSRPDPVARQPAGKGPTGYARVVCDLTGVDFLTAGGVGALAAAAATATAHGVHLHLVADSRPVRRVLALTDLDSQLPVSRSLADALTETAWQRAR